MNFLDNKTVGLSELTSAELIIIEGGKADNPIYWLGHYAHAAYDKVIGYMRTPEWARSVEAASCF